MRTGHNSHQLGLDADIWLTPMPDRELTRLEREEMSATMVVAEDRRDVDPKVWTPAHLAVIKAAALHPRVQRIFVNAAIKKALCRDAGSDRAWLGKVQPWWGHDYHFHVRLRCPSDDPECVPQPPRPADDGCGKELDHWFTDAILYPKPSTDPAQAEAAAQDGRPSDRLPPGAAGTVTPQSHGARSRGRSARKAGAPCEATPSRIAPCKRAATMLS